MGRQAILLPSANRIRSATLSITGASASSGYPLANLKDGDVTLPFIAAATGAARLIADCTSAVQVDDAFLPFHNIPAGTAVRFEGHTANSWGAPDVSVPVSVAAYTSLGPLLDPIAPSLRANVQAAYSASARTKRYWSWSIAAFADPLAVGEWLMGELSELWGFSPDENADSQDLPAMVKTTAFGNRWSFRYPLLQRRRKGRVPVPGGELRARFLALEQEIGGTADPFIWVDDLDDATEGLLMQLESAIEGTTLASELTADGSPAHVLAESLHMLRLELLEVPKGLPL